MGPYVTIALLITLLWIVIAVKPFPRGSDATAVSSVPAAFRRLLRTPHYMWGVIAQFFYVGAQIGVWSFTIRYVMVNLGLDEAAAATYYLASIVLFSVSRFACTALMRFILPQRLLAGLALAAVALSGIVIFGGGYAGVYALVGISACMSLMFPTIFALAVHGLGADTKLAGSGLIMAILGGAVLTAVQGQLSDAFGIHAAYAVPVVCFLVIAYYGFRSRGAPLPAAA
jgi:MFS transporter, FHS family, L-fucose permease